MNILKKYITNVSALQYIQLLRFAVLFLIGTVFTRFYSAADIGIYETLLFIAGAVSYFWLQGVLQTFLSFVKNNSAKKNPQLFNVFLLLVGFSAIATILLVVFKQIVLKDISSNNNTLYFNLLLILVFFNAPSYLIEYLYLSTNKAQHIVTYGTISYGLQFFLLALPPILGIEIYYSVIGLIIVNILRFIFLIVLLKKHSTFKIDKFFLKNHLKTASPLIIAALIGGAGPYIDGALITFYFNNETFAIFRYGAKELPVIYIMANALSNSLIPVFNNLNLPEALTNLKKNAQRLMHLMFPLSIIFLIISNYIFPLLFTSAFTESAKVFNVYLLLVISRLVFPQTILIGKKNTSAILKVSVIELIINITLSVFLIQKMGILGVAFATLIANFFDKLLLMIIVFRKYKIKPKQYISSGWYFIYSALLILVYYLCDFILFTK